MAHPHKKVVCSNCNVTIAQCRCFGLKAIEYVESCEKCKPHLHNIPETKEQQRARVTQLIAQKIGSFGDDSNAAALAAFKWLIDSQIKIEELEKELRKKAEQ